MAMGIRRIHSSKTEFPEIDWYPYWPKQKTVLGRVVSILLGLFLVLGIATWSAIVLTNLDSGFAVVFGGLGFLALLLGAALPFSVAITSRISAGVRSRTDTSRGRGVSFKVNQIIRSVLLMAAGAGTYGVSSWIAWRSGSGSELLPASKANAAGANFIFGVALVMWAFILLALIFYFKLTVTFYADGVLRVITLPLQFRTKKQFIRWDEIVSVVPNDLKGSANNSYAVIELHLDQPREPVQHSLWDKPDRVSIPVYLMACEANTLVAITQMLVSDPSTRPLLGRPDAPRWFAPPPLREQYRLSESKTNDGSRP